jgi:hypothetical protein
MSINNFVTCPADCNATVNLTAIQALQDCTTYEQKYSQVKSIVLTPDGEVAPFNWSAAPAVTLVSGEIDNTTSNGTKSKWLVGEGGIPAAEKIVDEYPGRKTRTSFRTYTLTFNVKNLSQAQYDFLRLLQCGVTDFKLWYETVGGHLFGGAAGVDISGLDVDFIYGEGRDDKEYATITLTWEADGDPPRGVSPLA